MELMLDRKLSERRIFPAVDIRRSGTRREEDLLTTEELEKVWTIRKGLNDAPDYVESFFKKVKDTKNNAELLATLEASKDKPAPVRRPRTPSVAKPQT